MTSDQPADERERNFVRVRIGLSEMGLPSSASHAAVLNRSSIPPDVLPAHENFRNTPDISGRSFSVLICQKPELRDGLWALKPEGGTKDAWTMRDEFLNLLPDPDPALGWNWSVWDFLRKWGIWGDGQILVDDLMPSLERLTPLLLSLPGENFLTLKEHRLLMVIPHLVKNQQEKYRRAVLPSNARSWLRSHPLSLESADEFPFFHVRKSYCTDAIEATITIDHLGEAKFGICKRCHKVFRKEKKYKMSYCDRTCASAASVARFREKQRKTKSKAGGKRNA